MATKIVGDLILTGSAVTMSLPNLTEADTNYVSILTYNTQSGQVGYIAQSNLTFLQGGVGGAAAFWTNETSIEPYTPLEIGDSGLILTSNLRLGYENYIMPGASGAFAAGYQTTASHYAFAAGYQTKALGSSSHATGENTVAVGIYSLAAGKSTIASGSGQVVVGSFNAHNNVSSSFVVGGGSSNSNRRDIFSVDLGSNSSGSVMIPCNPSAVAADGHPSNPRTGSLYFNPTLSMLWVYTGTAWKSASLT